MNPTGGAPERVTVRAPAKLNLYLDVLSKRDDGYHEIETVMQAIDLCDTLTVEKLDRPGIQLEIRGRPCPSGRENLAFRAAESALSALQVRTGLKIVLEKNIPMGAGLGGGSADAGAVLRAVDRLFRRALTGPRLVQLASSLGSDVPFFLEGGTAVATGRGEWIEPLPAEHVAPAWYVVVYPGAPASTPVVYGRLDFALTFPRRNLRQFLHQLRRSANPAATIVPDYYNALLDPFRSAYPELARYRDRVISLLARPLHLTGSGSAMFTPVPDEATGREVARVIRSLGQGEVFVSRGPFGDSPADTA